jgi:hypothetical protein
MLLVQTYPAFRTPSDWIKTLSRSRASFLLSGSPVLKFLCANYLILSPVLALHSFDLSFQSTVSNFQALSLCLSRGLVLYNGLRRFLKGLTCYLGKFLQTVFLFFLKVQTHVYRCRCSLCDFY